MKPYYYVYDVTGEEMISKRDSLEEAQSMAETFARAFPGHSFEILQCIGLSMTAKCQTFWMDGFDPMHD